MATGPQGHSPVGFSKAARYLACPGSVKAEEGLPNVSSEAADRGTFMHEVAARCLEQRSAEPAAELEGDELEIVQAYVAHVLDRKAREFEVTNLLVEEPFHLPHVHELLYGTADAVLLGVKASEKWLEVVDLKTGYGFVPTRKDGRINPQLGGYLLGAIAAVRKLGFVPDHFAITVVQPKRGGPRREIVTRAELAGLATDLSDAVELALSDDAPRSAGEHCGFCLARGTCPALREAALTEARVVFDDPVALEAQAITEDTDGEDLARALEAANVVETWLRAVRAEAFKRLNAGTEVPGYKLVAKRGRRSWLNEGQAYQRLMGAGLGEDEVREWKLLTPAKVEKLVKKAKVDVDLAELTITKSSGAKLAPESDPAPALPAGAAAVFDDLPTDGD